MGRLLSLRRPAAPHLAELPALGATVEVAVSDDVSYRAKVERAGDGVLTVSAPIASDVRVPDVGGPVTMAWSANRSRRVVEARMLGLTTERPWRWNLQPVGSVDAQSRRRYVRGGGGEPVQLWRPGAIQPTIRDGRLLDLSESGLRGRVSAAGFTQGDQLQIRLPLGDDLVVAAGEVIFVRSHTDPSVLDVVVEYDLRESTAAMVRRYLFAWEIDERRRAREAA
jgi:hypothetical protein